MIGESTWSGLLRPDSGGVAPGRLGPQHPGIEAVMPELRELLNDNEPNKDRR